MAHDEARSLHASGRMKERPTKMLSGLRHGNG